MEIKRKLGANNSMVCPRNLASRTHNSEVSFSKKLLISEDSEACGCDTSSSNAFHSTDDGPAPATSWLPSFGRHGPRDDLPQRGAQGPHRFPSDLKGEVTRNVSGESIAGRMR